MSAKPDQMTMELWLRVMRSQDLEKKHTPLGTWMESYWGHHRIRHLKRWLMRQKITPTRGYPSQMLHSKKLFSHAVDIKINIQNLSRKPLSEMKGWNEQTLGCLFVYLLPTNGLRSWRTSKERKFYAVPASFYLPRISHTQRNLLSQSFIHHPFPEVLKSHNSTTHPSRKICLVCRLQTAPAAKAIIFIAYLHLAFSFSFCSKESCMIISSSHLHYSGKKDSLRENE